MDSENVYIGRAGVVFIDGVRFPKTASMWANPIKLTKDGDREQVTRRYREYIMDKIQKNPELYDLSKLKGKKLGCWCKPETCHGDVLSELIHDNDIKLPDIRVDMDV
mgnify:CR=1 FL=1